MAYKFQLGDAVLSGSITAKGDSDQIQLVDDDENKFVQIGQAANKGRIRVYEAGSEKLKIQSGFISGSRQILTTDLVVGGTLNLTGAAYLTGALTANGATKLGGTLVTTGSITSNTSVNAGTSFIIGSADLNEADMEKLDGITNGTAAVNKAVVLDASKNIATLGTVGCGAITSTGASTMGSLNVGGTLACDTSFTLDAVVVNATELGFIDGVTAGTAAASKALVLDGSKNIATIGTVGCGAITSTGASSLGSISSVGAITSTGLLSSSAGLNVVGVANFIGNVATSGSLSSSAGLQASSGIFNSTLNVTGAVKAASTLHVTGAAMFNSTLNVTGAITAQGKLSSSAGLELVGDSVLIGGLNVSGSSVKFAGIADTAIAVGSDALYFKDSDNGTMKSDSVADIVDAMAGTTTATGLNGGGDGTLAIRIDSLNAEAVATGDFIMFSDVGDNGLHKESVDDLFTKGLPLVTEASIDVAADYLVFLDGGISGDGKKEKWADIATAAAGTGVTATNGVFSVDTAGGDRITVNGAIGDANATLAAGLNFGNTAVTAVRTWSLPHTASATVGDIVIVKANTGVEANNISISRNSGCVDLIDGNLTSVNLQSSFASVAFIYSEAGQWRIY